MQANPIKIVKLFLTEMPGMHAQFRRPFDIVARVDEVPELVTALSRDSGDPLSMHRVTPEAVAPYVGAFLRHSSHAMPANEPPNGWVTPRFSFLLIVEAAENQFGIKRRMMISGYTSYLGISTTSGTLDPLMEFHINSMMELRSWSLAQPDDVPTIHHDIASSDHLFSDTEWNGLYAAIATSYETLRPVDLLTAMEPRAAKMGESLSTDEVIDMRSVLAATPRISDRLNVDPAFLVARVGDAFAQALAERGLGCESVYEAAVGFADEIPAGQNFFLDRLLGRRERGATRIFTMTDLVRIDPAIDSKTVVVMGNRPAVELLAAQQHYGFDEESLESRTAYAVAMSVPAIMSKLGIAHLNFSSISRAPATTPGEPAFGFSLTNLQPVNEDWNVAINVLQDMFVSEYAGVLAPQLTANSTIPLYLEVSADLFGLTVVDVAHRVDGQKKRFIMPTFADALVSPVFAKRHSTHSERALVAQELRELLNAVEVKLPTA
jgi:hypothetical protein